jgi:hypothetical protein
MAQFKEATLASGDKIIVNMDEIRTMRRLPQTTKIEFAKDHHIDITDTPDDLMMRKALRNVEF